MAAANPRDACIVAIARTPMGAMSGALASLPAVELGARAIKAVVQRAGIEPAQVQHVYFGNVLQAGVGQHPARQAALKAGIPVEVPATGINKVCASGMKAIMIGAQEIMVGMSDIVICGGMESMTNAPYLLKNARGGFRMGHQQVLDAMISDGLWDPVNDVHMGAHAEMYAEKYGLSRKDQDDFALNSYAKARAAYEAHAFDREMVPIVIKEKTGETVVNEDETLRKLDEGKLRALKPVFKKDGTVTAANASAITDGASAVVLMSRAKAEALGKPILAVIRGMADAEQAPAMFGLTPSLAIPKAVERAGISMGQVDYFEINEAFAVVSLANIKVMNLDPAKVNVWGGAVALGHPLGSSGCRIVCTLTSILQAKGARFGAAGICNGGGGASAIVIERC